MKQRDDEHRTATGVVIFCASQKQCEGQR